MQGMGMELCFITHILRSEDNLAEFVLSFLHMGSEDQIQFVNLGSITFTH